LRVRKKGIIMAKNPFNGFLTVIFYLLVINYSHCSYATNRFDSNTNAAVFYGVVSEYDLSFVNVLLSRHTSSLAITVQVRGEDTINGINAQRLWQALRGHDVTLDLGGEPIGDGRFLDEIVHYMGDGINVIRLDHLVLTQDGAAAVLDWLWQHEIEITEITDLQQAADSLNTILERLYGVATQRQQDIAKEKQASSSWFSLSSWLGRQPSLADPQALPTNVVATATATTNAYPLQPLHPPLPVNPQALPIPVVATNTPSQLQLQQIGDNATTLQQGMENQQQQVVTGDVPPLGATRTLLPVVTDQ